jgi:hypothetical protein
MSVTMARPRILRFVVPSSTPYSSRTPIDATFHWRRGSWVRYAARAALCLMAIATGLAIGGY